MRMSGQELLERLADAGVSIYNPSIADRVYVLPTRQWVAGPFAEALRTLQFEFRVKRWTAEDNDCDDFARLAAAFAQVLHTNTPGHAPATALAFGEFGYMKQDFTGGHAINFVLTGPGPEDVLFFEPQTGQFVTLTAQEKSAVIMLRC